MAENEAIIGGAWLSQRSAALNRWRHKVDARMAHTE